MHDVFISYSSINKDIADAICNRFESGSVKCWYAPQDIRPGEDWPTAIMEAIGQAKIFLLIYSESSNQSRQVMNEVAAAFDAGCIIVPFRLDQSKMCNELAYYLKRVHWMEAVEPPMTEKIELLFTTIKGALKTGKIPGSKGKKRRKKTGFLKVIALLLVVALIGTGAYGMISRRPQEMKFFGMSHIGLLRYPAKLFGMVSADGELLFLRNIETGIWSLVEMTNGYRSLAEIEYDPADPLNTEVFTQKLYDTVYFLEKDCNVVKIYDRVKNVWRNKDGVKLDLTQDEIVRTFAYYGENLRSSNDHLEEITLLIYNSQGEYFSRIITVTPDSEKTAHDISNLQLTDLICMCGISDCYYALFMDQSEHVKLIDLESGEMVESDTKKILEEYMPDAISHGNVLSQNKRYIHQKEYLEYGTQAKVWDLETGNMVFNKKFGFFYYLQFSGDHEVTYFNCADGCLYTCDLESGRSISKLDRKYFESNSAFLDVPYSFCYSEEFEVYFFLSQKVKANGEETKVRLTMTDLNGKILAMSDDIILPFGDHYETIDVMDEYVLLSFTPYDLDQVEDGVFTNIYRALYTVDDEGNMVFSKDYN